MTSDINGPEKRTELRLIVCEGQSDYGVLSALKKELSLSGFQIHFAKGRGKFAQSLKSARLLGFKAVLIVTDNDDDPLKSFKEVCDQIKAAGYSVPRAVRETVPADQNNPSLRVLMVPWDNECGAIETLCLPALEDLFSNNVDCLNKFIECTGGQDQWSTTRLSEMRTVCLLSCSNQREPKIGLGHFVARTNCGLNFRHSCFSRVSDELQDFSICQI